MKLTVMKSKNVGNLYRALSKINSHYQSDTKFKYSKPQFPMPQIPPKQSVLWTSASGSDSPYKPHIAKYMGVAHTTPMY